MTHNPLGQIRLPATTVPGVIRPVANSSSSSPSIGRLKAGLGAMQLRAIGVLRRGTWEAINKECAFLGSRMYDLPCTPDNVANYILIQDMYETSQRQLRLALSLSPKSGIERWEWIQAVMGWVSVAHFATAFPAQFLYDAQELEVPRRNESVFAYGPKGARDVLQDMIRVAALQGRKLFLPIPIQEFFRFEKDHKLDPPWTAQEKGLTRADQDLLERRRGQVRRTIRHRERDRPFIPTAKAAWLVKAGGSTTRTPPSLATYLGTLMHRERVAKVATFEGAIPSPQLLLDYVRAWAVPIASTSFERTIVNANNRYLSYLEEFPEKFIGFSPQEIREYQRELAKAKGKVIIGATATTATTVGAFTGIGIVGGLAITFGAAIAGAILKRFAGVLQGCPRAPRPIMLRSLRDPSCDISGGRSSATLAAIKNLDQRYKEAAEDPEIQGDAEGSPDNLPVGPEEKPDVLVPLVFVHRRDSANLLEEGTSGGGMLVGGAVAVLGILLLRRFL